LSVCASCLLKHSAMHCRTASVTTASIAHNWPIAAPQPYLLFLHGTTWPSKHWPEADWRALAEQMMRGLGYTSAVGQ
jgi:ADP-heptose:LPS heptosyltransferase